MKKLVLVLLIILVIKVAFTSYSYFQNQQQVKAVSSFEDCAKLFPVMESYPARCVTSDGRSFTQEIGNELEYRDEIVIDNPRPNQVATSPLRVVGKARGPWYFEADFPIELVDGNGKSLAVSHAQAQDEWMTEEFVPFEGKIIFERPKTQTGKLIIRNANPSGLPENQKELVMPVKFSE